MIRVRFDKNGFYHPAYGRLGRGANVGVVYEMPDEFAATEDVVVPVMDRNTRPPKQIGERTITQRLLLPSTAEILDDTRWSQEKEQAIEQGRPDPTTVRPKVVDADELAAAKAVAGRGRTKKAADAVARTTGTTGGQRRAARRAAAAAVPADE